jgi:hypothetical protein
MNVFHEDIALYFCIDDYDLYFQKNTTMTNAEIAFEFGVARSTLLRSFFLGRATHLMFLKLFSLKMVVQIHQLHAESVYHLPILGYPNLEVKMQQLVVPELLKL